MKNISIIILFLCLFFAACTSQKKSFTSGKTLQLALAEEKLPTQPSEQSPALLTAEATTGSDLYFEAMPSTNIVESPEHRVETSATGLQKTTSAIRSHRVKNAAPQSNALSKSSGDGSDFAVAGFICSVSFLITGFIGSITGLVLSAVALNKMKKTGNKKNHDLAVAGLILGIIGTAIFLALISIMILVFALEL